MPIAPFLEAKEYECPLCHKSSFESVIPMVTPADGKIKAGDDYRVLRSIEKYSSRDLINDLYSVVCTNCGFMMSFDSTKVDL